MRELERINLGWPLSSPRKRGSRSRIKCGMTVYGFSMVEVLLAMGIFAIFSIGIFYLLLDTVQRDIKITTNTEAVLYAQEGIEAVRNIANRNFLLLSEGDHGLNLNDGTWEFVPAPEYINDFYERTVTINDVYRNEEGNIDEEGTYLDVDVKKVISEVSWYQRGIIPRSVTLTSYISNWRGDDWIQTTCVEFNEGTFENTELISTQSPPEDNCAIKLSATEDASDFFSSADIGNHANDVDVDGRYAYLAAENSNKGLAIIDVLDPENPAIVSEEYVFGKGRYITKDGSTVYMGIKNWWLGISLVNVANPYDPYVKYAWWIGDYGSQPARGGKYLFMGVDAKYFSLLIYDVTTYPWPVLIALVNFKDETQAIEINNNYAYIGLDDDKYGLRILKIWDPFYITQTAKLDVGEEVNAIKITGSIAFIGTEDPGMGLQVVDISNPANPSIITSLNVGGEVQDLTISGNYLYAAINEENAGLAAIDISNPYNPTFAYTLDIYGKGTGIDSDENYLYISTTTHNKGLVIVGATEEGVINNGAYISNYFDTGSADTKYNFIEWDQIEVPGGAVKFQIRTADTVENLASAVWVGEDGTNATFYENSRTPITLDSERTGSRYFQFKAFIDSDGISSPFIESIKVNYTP